ncbi:MAG TPA: DNA oxidative demethylase AlkB [Gammaproteobacteria bacterium]|nr:DNA oxidative demethylase AlkB [Gammaproteobacteria bacterium]
MAGGSQRRSSRRARPNAIGAADAREPRLELGPGAFVLRGFALPDDERLRSGVLAVAAAAPFRHMQTPGGFTMSVAMTNCGNRGWVSDPTGYRYSELDPNSGLHWPAMPAAFESLARRAAAAAGFQGFAPDACLVNRYEPGARLTMHQDKDERDYREPIVSVSLGVPAVFMFGGLKRKDRPLRLALTHGDVVVWGGSSRLRYHGVAALKLAQHPFAGQARINLTLRRAS